MTTAIAQWIEIETHITHSVSPAVRSDPDRTNLQELAIVLGDDNRQSDFEDSSEIRLDYITHARDCT